MSASPSPSISLQSDASSTSLHGMLLPLSFPYLEEKNGMAWRGRNGEEECDVYVCVGDVSGEMECVHRTCYLRYKQ